MNAAPARPRPSGAAASAAPTAAPASATTPASAATLASPAAAPQPGFAAVSAAQPGSAAAVAPASAPAAQPNTAGVVDRGTLAPIDRAVLALGTALVSWSRRAERRGAAHPESTLSPAVATPAATATPALDAALTFDAGPADSAPHTARAVAAVDAADIAARERHHLSRTAATSRAAILAQRDLGINRLLR